MGLGICLYSFYLLQKQDSRNIFIMASICRSTCQACHNFFVKKPKIFENVKSERAAANFQKSRTLCASTIISKNSQI